MHFWTSAPKADTGKGNLVVNGGKGGNGGPGGENGGHGGHGKTPGGIPLEHAVLIAKIGDGNGGKGGEGEKGDGGNGGGGNAVQFGEETSLVKWKAGLGKPVPLTKTADFCAEYFLGEKIKGKLLDEEYMTVGGLLEASAADLQEVGCSKTQINNIKGALRSFLIANGAVVGEIANGHLVVDGGNGGDGGRGGKNGGHGGHGKAPGGIPLEHAVLIAKIGGGNGGKGGEGEKGDGGNGGRGDAVQFGEETSLVKWEAGLVDGKPGLLPITKTADFCAEYFLGEKIKGKLLDGEYMTVGGLLEASAADLKTVGCSKAQINDIKGALRSFLSAKGAVVYS